MESKSEINVNFWSIMWVVLINKKKKRNCYKVGRFSEITEMENNFTDSQKKVSKNGLLVSVSYNHLVITEYISNN